MKSSEDLRRQLRALHKKSYPAYKSLQGAYAFPDYEFYIDHVQGDPFASPSRVSIRIDHKKNGFPRSYYREDHTKTALEDFLIRKFYQAAFPYQKKASGSGKSGLIAISRCGQEILSRTACQITPQEIWVHFEIGFPAYGRTIQADELEKILFHYLPDCVQRSLYYSRLPEKEVRSCIFLAEDQHFLRKQLDTKGLCAFVANGSILPRQSGVSSLPMKQAVPFQSPDTLEVSFELPHKGIIKGMGIPKGVTLIIGGGYHGKSTLLRALELGVYDHIAGDGREFVITDSSAFKIRAEDGRCIKHTDISLFIHNLPNQKNTSDFSTEDASGSTSQAANVAEAWEANSRLFLMDEDTTATNFMVRDSLMAEMINEEKEPITPFLTRIRQLYLSAGISTIMAAGSCGAYFHAADTIIQMDCYQALDVTAKAKGLAQKYPVPFLTDDRLPENHPVPGSQRCILTSPLKDERRTKIKVFDKSSFSIGKNTVDLRYIEQLADTEQTRALAYCLALALQKYAKKKLTLSEIVKNLTDQIQKEGLGSLPGLRYVPSGLALPRIQEIYACLNRYRENS